MGWTVEKIVDKGEKGGFFVLDHLVRVGKYTYTDTARGKNLNVIEQLTQQYHNMGKCVVVDRGYPTIDLMRVARNEWGLQIDSTKGRYHTHNMITIK